MCRTGAVLIVLTMTALVGGPPVGSVSASASVTHGLRPGQESASAPWKTRLASWLEAVNEHKPGSMDMPARITGLWSEADLTGVAADFFALADILKRETTRTSRVGPINYRDSSFSRPELQQLLGLTNEEAASGILNRLLMRAAILHADVAMRVIPLTSGGIGCSARSSILVQDGNRVGAGCIGIHWAQGRLLLDSVRPDPGKDPGVRLWYQATIAQMLAQSDYANAESQLEHCRVLFPADPGILFEHGLFHEAFASPYIQGAARGPGSNERSPDSHLQEAEEMYRRAIRANANFIEARVHRGRVLCELGRPQDAAEELRQAAASAQGEPLRYFVELFLGRAEESQGNGDAARERYERASALYPSAQSPRLALSLMARQRGDRAGAQAAMQQLLSLAPAHRDWGDPWWVYHRWHNQSPNTLFTELYEPYRNGGGR